MSFLSRVLQRLGLRRRQRVTEMPSPAEPYYKYISTMVNSLTLSSDMRTLFLIDNGRAISFPLENSKGVVVGTLAGQITVASGLSIMGEAAEAAKSTPTLRLSVDKSVWTLAFLPKQEAVAVIGATEIDFSFSSNGDKNITPQGHLFDLKVGRVLRLRRVGDQIEVEHLVVATPMVK